METHRQQPAKNKPSQFTDHELLEAYEMFGSVWKAADYLGIYGQAVHKRLKEAGLIEDPDKWSEEEKRFLEDCYRKSEGDTPLDLVEITASLNRIFGKKRHKTNICRKAKELGLNTNLNRKVTPETLKKIKDVSTGMWSRKPHPRGMLGKTHTEEAKKRFSEISKQRFGEMTQEEKSKIATKATKTKLEKYGTGNPATKGKNAYSRCKRGYRADIGDWFFRSAWEANYARYLNLLISEGKIDKWEYEVDLFTFHNVTRRPFSYTPDFKVWIGDTYEYHEVKGWMDSKSRSKLKRMGKQYPNEKVIVVGQVEYKQILREFAHRIPMWEG